MAFAIVWAQPPHKEVGYDASSNVMTTVAYGYGNSVDQIIFRRYQIIPLNLLEEDILCLQ